MSVKAKEQPNLKVVEGSSSNQLLQHKVDNRQSKELVIAFSGAIGGNIQSTIQLFQNSFESAGYRVFLIKLSNEIKELYEKISSEDKDLSEDLQGVNLNELAGFERYTTMQDLGKYLRDKHEGNVLAQSAIKKIFLHRVSQARPDFEDYCKENGGDNSSTDALVDYVRRTYIPQKTVFLIDQLKHPDEAELLKDVYGDLFYLVGNLSAKKDRLEYLKKHENINDADAIALVKRDKKERDSNGQQLDKTLQLSDYFINISNRGTDEIKEQVERLVDLIHREKIITPSVDEYGMYVAYSSALSSACLSRVVGASILSKDGMVLSTGRNDVPRSGGGLYSSESKPDLRCYNHEGFCRNTQHIRSIRDQIRGVLNDGEVEKSAEIADEILSNTRLKDLIEFSRSIHAEMDALISMVRKDSALSSDATLYSTTFPCHNCARHIIASGIKRVVYIEPYEKSLATQLHDDAIALENEAVGMVNFIHFEGVSPTRYQDLFVSVSDRKDDDGRVILHSGNNLKPKIHQFLDSYRTTEVKVYEHMKESGLSD